MCVYVCTYRDILICIQIEQRLEEKVNSRLGGKKVVMIRIKSIIYLCENTFMKSVSMWNYIFQ